MQRTLRILTAPLVIGVLVVSVLVLRSEGRGLADGATTTVTSDRPYRPDLAQVEATTSVRPPATALDPGLVAAYDQARAAAADAGHDLVINSGFRTPERQQELLDEEVAKRGSFEEANRWVFTPERSMHVQGLAIDVGDGGAADWWSSTAPGSASATPSAGSGGTSSGASAGRTPRPARRRPRTRRRHPASDLGPGAGDAERPGT